MLKFAIQMDPTPFIQVLLPLRLEWEPYYRLPEVVHVKVGDRVRVHFAGGFYVGAVSALNVTPQLDTAKIQPIEALEDKLPAITPEEIQFWRAIAGYYLCTVGEVYKAAYPNVANHGSRLKFPEIKKADIKPQLTPVQEKAAQEVREGFVTGKPVLLHGVCGSGKTEVYLSLALETLQQGKSALMLVPDIALSRQLESRVKQVIPGSLVFNSAQSPAKRKLVSQLLREGNPCLVLGTRSALFLPYRKLGLIVVDDEHESSYKQDAPAPRYHARESAIMLSKVHGAGVVLGSATPSLESVYNAQCGRFINVDLKERFINSKQAPIELIDAASERRKKGMPGCLSLKLLARIKDTLDQGQQVLLLGPRPSWTEGKQLQDEVVEDFPEARIGWLDPETQADDLDILLGSTLLSKGFHSARLGLVAVIGADGILGRQDFRADERAFQVLGQLSGRTHQVVIQTREPSHPVFSALAKGEDPAPKMLEERRIAGYPPFTRMIKVVLRDSNAKRLQYLSRELAAELAPAIGPIPTGEQQQEIQLLLPRSKELLSRKAAIAKTAAAFEQNRKYNGHIIIDVDPV